MKRKHLFIMDPLEKLNLALDSSLRMAQALSRLNQEAYFCEIKDLFWASHKNPSAFCKKINFPKEELHIGLDCSKAMELRSFSSIHMRKDPPFDLSYISATWFLDPCSEDTLLVNHPHALRSFNEKLGILHFPEESKKSLVASNLGELMNFVKELPSQEAIIKPLELNGGKGVHRVPWNKNTESLLNKYTENETRPLLIQEFDKNIFQGEVRVFCVGGKAISWSLKIPKEGEFLANSNHGSTVESFHPSKSLVKKIENVSKRLLEEKIYFVGYDIISEEISEINITSPRLLVPEEDKTDYYEKIAEWVLKES